MRHRIPYLLPLFGDTYGLLDVGKLTAIIEVCAIRALIRVIMATPTDGLSAGRGHCQWYGLAWGHNRAPLALILARFWRLASAQIANPLSHRLPVLSMQVNLLIYTANVESSIKLWYTRTHGYDCLHMQIVFEIFPVPGMGGTT